MKNTKTTQAVDQLLKLFAGGVVLASVLVAPNAVALLEPLIGKGPDKDKEMKRLLYHMKRLDLIDTERLKDSNKYITLTDKGNERLNQVQLSEIEISTPKEWDGLWHIVTFDIPRDKRYERNEFLGHLHRLGFIKLLQSMWVFPFQCEQQIMTITSELELDKYIVYLTSKVERGQHDKLIKAFQAKLKNVKLVIR